MAAHLPAAATKMQVWPLPSLPRTNSAAAAVTGTPASSNSRRLPTATVTPAANTAGLGRGLRRPSKHRTKLLDKAIASAPRPFRRQIHVYSWQKVSRSDFGEAVPPARHITGIDGSFGVSKSTEEKTPSEGRAAVPRCSAHLQRRRHLWAAPRDLRAAGPEKVPAAPESGAPARQPQRWRRRCSAGPRRRRQRGRRCAAGGRGSGCLCSGVSGCTSKVGDIYRDAFRKREQTHQGVSDGKQTVQTAHRGS